MARDITDVELTVVTNIRCRTVKSAPSSLALFSNQMMSLVPTHAATDTVFVDPSRKHLTENHHDVTEQEIIRLCGELHTEERRGESRVPMSASPSPSKSLTAIAMIPVTSSAMRYVAQLMPFTFSCQYSFPAPFDNLRRRQQVRKIVPGTTADSLGRSRGWYMQLGYVRGNVDPSVPCKRHATLSIPRMKPELEHERN